ncbi:MAG: sigma-54-dependent transcriptional regulator [Bdellovibrionia bacterium]
MTASAQILICDHDDSFYRNLQLALGGEFSFLFTDQISSVWAQLQNRSFLLSIIDAQLIPSLQWRQTLEKFKAKAPQMPVVLRGSDSAISCSQDLIQWGAQAYVLKSLDLKPLMDIIRNAALRSPIQRLGQVPEATIISSLNRSPLIGNSEPMRELKRRILKAQVAQANVLITGETGSGKELVAKQMRKCDPRGQLEPWVAIDASTIQTSMAESILFGHERGSFTGADRMRRGLFEEAHGGVLYIDEIANMSWDVQCKLLRVLEEKEIRRVGSSRAIPLHFRIVSATNQDLFSLVKKGLFKEDLLQRLNVIPLGVPPLRNHLEDIPLLVDYFFSQQKTVFGEFKTKRFNEDAFEYLFQYSWPGNVRELSNLITYLSSMIDHDEITPDDLPDQMVPQVNDLRAASFQALEQSSNLGFYDQVAEFEKSILKEAYFKQRGRITQMAQALGMDRSHLYSKLKFYGIHPSELRGRKKSVLG